MPVVFSSVSRWTVVWIILINVESALVAATPYEAPVPRVPVCPIWKAARRREFHVLVLLRDGVSSRPVPGRNHTDLQLLSTTDRGIMLWVDENAPPCGKILSVTDTGMPDVPISRNLNFNCPPNSYYSNYRGATKPLAYRTSRKVLRSLSVPIPMARLILTRFSGRNGGSDSRCIHLGSQLNLVSCNDKKNPTDQIIIVWSSIKLILRAMTPYGSPSAVNHNFLDITE